MNRRCVIAFGLFLALALLVPARGMAESLWKRGKKSLYSDAPREFELYEIITVIVEERTVATNEVNTKTDKSTKWEAEIDEWMRFETSHGGVRLTDGLSEGTTPSVDVEASYEREGKGATARSGKISTKVAGEVVEILPNGNLKVKAMKSRRINDETETVILWGDVRPEDISEGNEVRSDDIANLKISYEGEGALDDTQSRGFLSWLADKIWPF